CASREQGTNRGVVRVGISHLPSRASGVLPKNGPGGTRVPAQERPQAIRKGRVVMSVSSRRSAALAAALLAVLATQAQAQRILNPPAPMQPQVLPPNAGVLGTAAPGSMAGYTPSAPALGASPATVTAPAYDPYALSTVGGFNPYTSPSASMSSSPYSLSTAPGGGAPYGAYGMPFFERGYPFWGGPGLAP